jgi:hypothetical protein
MKVIPKKCIICSKKFTKNWQKKFCSRDCYYKWQKENPNKGCFEKGNTNGFQKGHKPLKGIEKGWFQKGQIPWTKGLKGLQPWHNISGLNTGIPWIKGKHIKTNDALDKWRKKGKFIKGKNHWNWKGGRSKLRERIENLPIYKKWHKDCLGTAKWICEDCGMTGIYLHVHHKKEFNEILDDNKITTVEQAKKCKELWDINNGKALCVPCHKKYHSYLNSKIL